MTHSPWSTCSGKTGWCATSVSRSPRSQELTDAGHGPATRTDVALLADRNGDLAALSIDARGCAAAYHRAISRSEAEWPLVEAVARVALDGSTITSAAVAVGGVARAPLHLPRVAELPIGRSPTPETLAAAADAALDEAHATAGTVQTGYKQALLRAAAERALGCRIGCGAPVNEIVLPADALRAKVLMTAQERLSITRWPRAPLGTLSMKTGAGATGESVLLPAGWSAGGSAVGDERVQVERPQPRSGEDDDLDARGTGGTMRGPSNGNGGRHRRGWPGRVSGSRAHLSIAASRGDQVGWEGLRSGGASQSRALYEARGCAAPAGAKGRLVESMCQIASARRRARSTWAILGPRWRPNRVLVRR